MINKYYDSIKEPWRFLLALALCFIGFMLLTGVHNVIGAIYMIGLFAIRVFRF